MKPWPKVILWLFVLIGICAVNFWAFDRFLDSNYLRWYVAAGPFIGLATAAFGAAWGKLDNQIGLVSTNPLEYIGSCLQVAGLPIEVFGGHLQSKRLQNRTYLLDILLGLPLTLVFIVAIFSWLFLIAPLQYFVLLVCGAPSRMALASSFRMYAKLDDLHLVKIENPSSDVPIPREAWDVSMRDKPVTLANAFSAATLFLIGKLWN